MTNLISIITIFSFSLFFSHIFKKKIEETTIFSIFLIILILYIFSLLSILNLGWFFITFVGLFLLIFLFLKRKKIKTKLLFTYGFLFLIITTTISIIVHRHRVVLTFDEFNFWFLAIKNMYLNNEIFTTINSNVMCKDYTPASTIFHYFWLKTSPNFNESLVFISMNFFIFSLLAPALSVFKKKQWKKALISCFLIFTLPLTLYDYLYTGAYVDGLMGLIFAHILYTYFFKKTDQFKLYIIILGLIILTLTKMTGILLSVSAVIIISSDLIFFSKNKKHV